jgi:hypothetical protein
MKVPTFIDVVEIMISFTFPRHLPSTGRGEFDIRFIATTGSMCISDHQGVFTLICHHFCGKTVPYYTRQALPYTIKEGGQQNLLLLYTACRCMVPADKNSYDKLLQCSTLPAHFPPGMM